MKPLATMATVAVLLVALCVTFTTATAQSAASASFERMIPACTFAEIHDGSCVVARTGRIARLIDAAHESETSDDRCGEDAHGGGGDRVLCRYDGRDWREASPRSKGAGELAAATAPPRVLDILNPPGGSGLVPPVGDGIDGQPLAPRTNDAPAINAAIQYACDNGYDIAYLGPGHYRIGVTGTIASFYSGVRIDAKRCPNGIKFYGAGAGRTVLLANGQGGQYLVFTGDEYVDNTKVRRIGWGAFGDAGRPEVIGVTTGVSPPVVTGDADSYFEDGDTVYVRNCSGAVEMNDRVFTVNACTHTAPFSCELQDEFGVDIDATLWSPWTADTKCVVGKLNTEFEAEIAYMTIRDDDPAAHSTTVCNPSCLAAMEESHGIGILQGGGVTEVHHVVIDTVGDEAIDISAPESPTYVHDVTILNPEVGGATIYQGVGVRIEDILVHKGTPSTQYLSGVSAGQAIEIDGGNKSWRTVDVEINRLVATGGLRYGFAFLTNPAGVTGQYVSGVSIKNSAVDIDPASFLCALGQSCGSFWIRAKFESFPMEDIEISNNLLTGTAYLDLGEGAGDLRILDNTFTPIPNIEPKWAIRMQSKNTTFAGNHVQGFERGCVRFEPYSTNGGSNGTITSTIQNNVFECDSNATNEDPMVGPHVVAGPEPAAEDEAWFRILDNQFTTSSGDAIRHGIHIPRPFRNVEICRNTFDIEESIVSSPRIAISSKAPDQVICENSISINGTGIRTDASGTAIVANQIDGDDTASSSGVVVAGASNTLVSKNTITGYQTSTSSGIKVDAGTNAQNRVWIVGNTIDAASRGIEVDGNTGGIDEISIAGNLVDLESTGPATGILLNNATDVRVTANDLIRLDGASVDALLTTGTTDFIIVRDNLAQGGGTLKFGTTGGDPSCDTSGGVGDHSTCSDNVVQ